MSKAKDLGMMEEVLDLEAKKNSVTFLGFSLSTFLQSEQFMKLAAARSE